MTIVNNNTFTGPNAGIVGGYVPLTTIESTSMDGDLDLVKDDLDYHLSVLQAIYIKLDTIETGAAATPSASTMVSTINASAELIDADNLESTVALLSNIIFDIEAHRVTTTQSAMHPEDSIKSTGQTYSYTPSSIITSCQNVLDEINNVRIQIHKILGQTTWIDTPDTTLAAIKTKLDTIESGATGNQTGSEIKILYQAESNAYTDTKDSKLDGIENGANNYLHPTDDGYKHVPANSTVNDGKILTAGAIAGEYTWETLVKTVSIFLPAEAAYLPITNPAVLIENIGDTVYVGYSYLAFDDTTSEHAVWRVPMPDYDGGDIVITAYSKVTTTPTGSVTLQYNILTIGLANSEVFNTATTIDTGINISHSLNTSESSNDIMIAYATIDPANVATNDLLVIELSRDVANDTLIDDGELIGIMLEYTRGV